MLAVALDKHLTDTIPTIQGTLNIAEIPFHDKPVQEVNVRGGSAELNSGET